MGTAHLESFTRGGRIKGDKAQLLVTLAAKNVFVVDSRPAKE